MPVLVLVWEPWAWALPHWVVGTAFGVLIGWIRWIRWRLFTRLRRPKA